METLAAIECILLRPSHEQALKRFFSDLAAVGDDAIFHPHAGDLATLHALAEHPGRDLHAIFVEGGRVHAYGLLRGWNEGYAVPSLGIAVHPERRTAGLGRLMMEYLEAMGRFRGAPAIRLRVHKVNTRAIEMYERRGYTMSLDPDDSHLLVGVKQLGAQE